MADPLLHIGTITGTHGLRGDLKAHPADFGLQVLLEMSRVVLCCADGKQVVVEVAKAAPHKHSILLHLKGFEHINSVEQFINAKLMVTADKLPELDEGEYYWHELEGLQVVDTELGVIGKLVAMLETGAHDIYVVDGDHGEVMIPAVAAFINDIDLHAGQMQVTLPAGLVDLNG
jgi:16S rRNA processing protein RimM